MARSNSPAQQTAPPGTWPAAEVDAYGRPIDPRWAQQQPQQQHPQAGYAEPPQQQPGYGYAANQGYAPQGYPQQAYAPQHGYQGQADYPTAPPQHYADPHAGHQGYGAPQPQAPQPMSFADAYAQAAAHNARHQPAAPQPHYEPYNPQAPAQQGYEHFDPQLHADPHAHAAHQQPAPHAQGYDPRQHYEPTLPGPAAHQANGYGAPMHGHEHQGYDPVAHAAHAQQQADPRQWDLSHYPPPGTALGHGAPNGYAVDPHNGHHDPRFAQAPHAPQGWPQQPHQDYGQPAYDPALQQGYGQPGLAQPAAVHPAEPAYNSEAEGQDEDEEAPRRPKAMLVVGALVGAIALGAGLAYAYKRFVATANTAKVPVVSAPKTPTRTAPVDPGGKNLPHTDKRFLNPHDEKGGPQTGGPGAVQPPTAAPQTAADPDQPKKVTTVIVNRDGSITPTAPAAPAPLPGMVVEGLPQGPELRGAAPPDRPVAPPVTPVQKAPAQPKVAELPLPKVKAEPKAETATPPPAKKKPAVRDDLVAQKQPGAPTAQTGTSPPGSNGYVAVLTSRKTREEALKSFADLQQKYGEVIGSRPMDVREVNLGEKGVWFRSIVGPPGSKEAANALCKQLKEQGFSGCFMMAY